MFLFKQRSRPDGWLVAWVVALALHGLMYVGFRVLLPFSPAPVQAQSQDSVEVVFVDLAAPEEPKIFTELPPDRKDEAPEKADFLSNVTSRARDQVPGGNTSLPRMQGEGDAPEVALDAAGKPATPAAAEESPKTDAQLQSADPSAAISLDPNSAPRTPEDGQPAQPGGLSDIRQPDMANADGNASLTGDVSLSTMEWNWAPWLQRFRRKLMSRWYAPSAYYLGILKEGGWATVEVEVSPSGEMLRLQLLEEQGHPSLISAATSALVSVAPMEPLPKDFPEKTLVLRIRMIYPRLRPR